MTAFHPVPPMKAVELIEAAGIVDGRRVIADNAAAGLVKSYARVIETREVSGTKARVMGAAVPVELWQRIIHDGVVDDVWTGGTVRLAAASLIGGAPAVSITGIGFAERHLRQTIEHHAGTTRDRPCPRKLAAVKNIVVEELPSPAAGLGTQAAPTLPHAHVPEGATTITVAVAMAASGLGRTTIDKLMKNGALERVKVGSRTLITVESLKMLLAK